MDAAIIFALIGLVLGIVAMCLNCYVLGRTHVLEAWFKSLEEAE